MNSTAHFRFHGPLGAFLPREQRDREFAYPCARAATLKNAVEALGAPHTEVGRLQVNGSPATLDRIVREGDRIEVFPWPGAAELLPGVERRFVADAHLGGLARFMRMLGFDTLHRNALLDAEIRRLAHDEWRIVLTRDRELLKCREIAFGCYVHERKAEAQLQEVALRFDLAAYARPFTLCLRCNAALEPASAREAQAYAPEANLEHYTVFRRCAGCGRIYWPGTHYERMRATLGRMLGRAPDSDAHVGPAVSQALDDLLHRGGSDLDSG